MLRPRAALAFVLVFFGLPCAGQWAPPALSHTLPEGSGHAVAVNETHMEVFVANEASNHVAVMNQERRFTYVPTGRAPRYIAAHRERFFTSNAGDGTITARLPESSPTATATFDVGGFGPLVAHPDGNRAYMLRLQDGAVIRVDAREFSMARLQTGGGPGTAIALEPAGTRLLVSESGGAVRMVELFSATDPPASAGIAVPGMPGPLAFAGGNRAYVLTDAAGASLVELDLASRTARPIALPGSARAPRAIGVASGTVFAGFSNELVLLDIASGNLAFIAMPGVIAIDADPTSGLAFVLDGARTLHVIDARTMRHDRVPLGSRPSSDVAFMYKLCNAYVAGDVLSVVHAPCGDFHPGGINAQGLWWAPSGAESGWGINITHQGEKLFATWFTYDAAGQPLWLVMSNGERTGSNQYRGTLYQTDGPSFASARFDPSRVAHAPVGTLTIDVFTVNSAQLIATVNGTSISKQLAKQQFAVPMPVCGTDVAPGAAPNYTALWWASPPGSESGWGLNIQHQGDILFVTWFTYDTMGRVLWFVGSNITRTGNATYSGTLYRTTGPPLTAVPWDPDRVSRIATGHITLGFTDDANGTFQYSVGTVSGSKQITRQVFAAPQSVCR